MARRFGAAPNIQGFGVLVAHAGARRIEIGAVIGNCTRTSELAILHAAVEHYHRIWLLIA